MRKVEGELSVYWGEFFEFLSTQSEWRLRLENCLREDVATALCRREMLLQARS